MKKIRLDTIEKRLDFAGTVSICVVLFYVACMVGTWIIQYSPIVSTIVLDSSIVIAVLSVIINPPKRKKVVL